MTAIDIAVALSLKGEGAAAAADAAGVGVSALWNELKRRLLLKRVKRARLNRRRKLRVKNMREGVFPPSMSDRSRSIVVLLLEKQMTCSEIALTVGCSRQNVHGIKKVLRYGAR
jgi:hypothetical protein